MASVGSCGGVMGNPELYIGGTGLGQQRAQQQHNDFSSTYAGQQQVIGEFGSLLQPWNHHLRMGGIIGCFTES